MTAYAVIEPSSSGLAGFGQWRYRTATDAFPAAGRLQFDNVTIDSATEFYINATNDGSVDMSNFLDLVEPGDLIYVQVSADSTQFVVMEVGTSSNAGGVYTFPLTIVEAQGSAPSNNTLVTVVATVAGGAAPDHGSLAGLADDDHLQYLLLAGRAGGQGAFGGLNSGDVLTLRGSVDADLGFIDLLSPIRIDVDWTVSGASDVVTWNPTVPSSGSAVSGFLRVAPTITIDNGLFIFSTVFDSGRYLQTVAPGFAVHTLFLGQPNLETMTAGVQPNQVFIYAAQPQMENNGAGALGTPIANIIGMTFTPQMITRFNGDTLSATNITGVQVSPAFSTVFGSTIAFGTVRGIHMTNPAQGLFQPGAGAESMTAYVGVEVNAIPFGGNVTKRALRSALVAATNTRMIENTSTAESDFGSGHIHLNDNIFIKFGNTVASPDFINFWATAESKMAYSTAFGVGGNPMYLHGTVTDEWIFSQNSGGAFDIGIGFDVNAIVFGTTAPTPNSNNWFVQFAAPNLRQVQIGGEYSDVLWTAGGAIDVNGMAVSDLQAFKINSPAVLLNGGTISDISNLFVQAMPSFGATRTQALRVLGRSRLDGHLNHASQSPGQLTANTNDWQLGQNNNQREVALMTTDGGGPYNVTGIDSSFGFAQTGDMILIINISADTITFTNQDVLSLAVNRFITATGAGIAVGPNESIRFWYDDTGVTRWRHIQEQ